MQRNSYLVFSLHISQIREKKNFLRLQMSAICPLDGLLTKLYMYTCKTLEPCSM